MTSRSISGSPSVRLLGLALAFVAVHGGLSASRCRACSTIAPAIFEIDPALRAIDTSPPTPFTDIDADVSRWASRFCKNGECTESSCGDSGSVAFQFALPPDVFNAQLGYRLVWLRGTLPASLARELTVVRPVSVVTLGEGQISLSTGFQDAARIDAEIALVAVDKAGNESAPSEPVHLTFSGCTNLPTGGCLETAACNVTQLGRDASSSFGGFAVSVALALLYRRRRRARMERALRALGTIGGTLLLVAATVACGGSENARSFDAEYDCRASLACTKQHGIRSDFTLEACISESEERYDEGSKSERALADQIAATCHEQSSCDYVTCAQNVRGSKDSLDSVDEAVSASSQPFGTRR